MGSGFSFYLGREVAQHQRDVAHSSTSKEGTVAGARMRDAPWEGVSLERLEEPDPGGLGAQRVP